MATVRTPKVSLVRPPLTIRRQAEQLVLKTAREFISWPDNQDRIDNLRAALNVLDMVQGKRK